MSIRIDNWFVAGNAQKTNSDWNATSGFAQILNKPTNLVHTTGDETIAGIKTFNSIPLSVTPLPSSNDTSIATTEFVNSKISSHDNNITAHNDIRQTLTSVSNSVTSSIEAHNINNSAHNDIRQLITNVSNSISPAISNHNISNNTHTDIRDLISTNTISISELTSGLTNETSQRNADVTNLQQQIDALTSKGDVADIVGTYQDLLNYDTSSLINKSIIKVLTDITHDNAASYYKWNTNTSAFDYVGSEAPTYTKSEIDAMDDNNVHKTGNENIAGTKTFTNIPVFTGGSSAAGGSEGGEIQLASVANNVSYSRGYIDVYGSTPSDVSTHCIRIGIVGSTGLNVYADNTATVGSPAPSDDILSTKIATVGWVNSPDMSTNVVHRSGDETIAGTKTFTTQTPIRLKNTSYVLNDFTNNYNIGMLEWIDNTNTQISYLKAYSSTNGSIFNEIGGTYGTNAWKCGLKVGYDSTADVMFTYAPTPPVGSNGNNIATTEWCYDPAKSTNLVHRSGDETIAGTKTFSSTINGTAYRAQWGDLAEYYLTDEKYPKGTLVQFGGEKEITIAKNKINAVITSEPGFILNGELENSQAIALIGRVPVRVIGKVKKFDKIALSYVDGVGCVNNDSENPIGIALEDKNDSDEGLIICSVKLSF